ncbi:hypothetical protein [Desertibaculum subflavum]|uniref:hypothetical protein n=1 Tax=Desertibaculum subflavum TaxID=2268458 RepID=UPI000E65F1E2
MFHPAMIYAHHRIETAPRRWREVAEELAAPSRREHLRGGGAALYGIWRSQIGRPRDELNAITVWPDGTAADRAEAAFLQNVPDVRSCASELMQPTLRPADPTPPRRQGNYAFRWFATPQTHWDEFLALCAEAWPGFEAAYDSQVIGLWRMTGGGTAPTDAATGAGLPGVRSLLLTRRPDLAMWERSKLPQGAAEQAVRDALSRRYDLCDWTVVSTATLLTAEDRQDSARWT